MKYVTGLEFNESMSDIIQDFEGNYWMTSYRKGLMLLSRSKFQNGSMKYGLDETIVNCITEYCGKLYIGTDDGLRIINADGTLDRDSDLVTMLNGKVSVISVWIQRIICGSVPTEFMVLSR